MDKVSVVLITYNAEKFVKFTLESILNQTYKNLELIVIDDGSKDNTVKIINQFSNKLELTLIRKPHLGNVGMFRNEAIKRASGKYVAFIDSDDVWKNDKISKQIENIRDYKLICTNAQIIDEYGNLISPKYFKEFNESFKISLQQIVSNNIIITSSVMAEKDLFSELKFDEEVGIRGEDYILWLKILETFKVYFLNEILLNYRIHGKNLSFKSPEEKIELLKRTLSIRENYIGFRDEMVRQNAIQGILPVYKQLIKSTYEIKNYESTAKYLKLLSEYKKFLTIKENLKLFFFKIFFSFKK